MSTDVRRWLKWRRSGALETHADACIRVIVRMMARAQYDPDIHRANPTGHYPICFPPVGRVEDPCCPRCGLPYESDRTCPAVPAEKRRGPEVP